MKTLHRMAVENIQSLIRGRATRLETSDSFRKLMKHHRSFASVSVHGLYRYRVRSII